MPGRSVLPVFLPWEKELDARLDTSRKTAETRVKAACEEAARIRRDGEARLARLVLDAQEEAMREAKARARDRVSGVRAETQRWVDRAEEAARQALDEALDLCCEE